MTKTKKEDNNKKLDREKNLDNNTKDLSKKQMTKKQKWGRFLALLCPFSIVAWFLVSVIFGAIGIGGKNIGLNVIKYIIGLFEWIGIIGLIPGILLIIFGKKEGENNKSSLSKTPYFKFCGYGTILLIIIGIIYILQYKCVDKGRCFLDYLMMIEFLLIYIIPIYSIFFIILSLIGLKLKDKYKNTNTNTIATIGYFIGCLILILWLYAEISYILHYTL